METAVERVKTWLDKSGHPFEWKVAETVRSAGFRLVELGRPYADPTTDTIGEADVTACLVAGMLRRAWWSYFVVECKQTTQPWALFADGRERLTPEMAWASTLRIALGNAPTEADQTALNCVPLGPDTVVAYAMKGLPESPPKGAEPDPAEATDTAKRDRPKARDFAREALQQISSATRGVLRDMKASDGADPEDGALVIAHAVIVTTSPLVECRLMPDGSSECTEVTRAVLLHRPTSEPQFQLVHVVHESCVAAFALECLGSAQSPTTEVMKQLSAGPP